MKKDFIKSTEKDCKKCKYIKNLKENYKNTLTYAKYEANKEKEDAIFKSVLITIFIMTSLFLILKFCI